jgi:hypothetical protein
MPVPGAAFSFCCGLQFEEPLAVAILIIGPKRLANLAAQKVCILIGDRGKAQDFPAIRSLVNHVQVASRLPWLSASALERIGSSMIATFARKPRMAEPTCLACERSI